MNITAVYQIFNQRILGLHIALVIFHIALEFTHGKMLSMHGMQTAVEQQNYD